MSDALVPADAAERPLSGFERVWLVAGRIAPPFAIQVVAEGQGEVDVGELEEAVAAAASANPGWTMRLSGVLGRSRWRVSGEPPPVTAVDGGAWGGNSPEGAEFLRRPISPEGGGPGCEVLLSRGPTTRLVFRAHHALMDGVATREFAFDVFRALRGEAPLGSLAGPPVDVDLARGLDAHEPEEQPLPHFRAPTGDPGPEEGWTFHRVRVAWSGRRVLSRTVEALVDAAASFSEGPWRVAVPVDLRRHRPGMRSSANLTGIVHVEGRQAELRAPAVDASIQAALEGRLERGQVLVVHGLRWLPLWLLTALGRIGADRERKLGAWPTSATVSNLGRQSLASVEAPGFAPEGLFWIPPSTPSLPFFLGLLGHEGGLELCASVPRHLATGGRLEAVMGAMAEALEGG